MVVIDDDGRIVRYNSRALQLGHFETHRELVGRQFYEAVLGDTRAIGDGCPLSKALQDGVLGRATMRSETRGLLFDVVASPHPNGGAVVTFDVTARAQVEEDRVARRARAIGSALHRARGVGVGCDLHGRPRRTVHVRESRARDGDGPPRATSCSARSSTAVIDARDREAMRGALMETLTGRRQRRELRYLDAQRRRAARRPCSRRR